MSFRAVIFDLGGVLVRTEDRTPRIRLAEHLGLTYNELSALIFDSPSAHQAMKGEITAPEHWEAIQEALGIAQDEIVKVKQGFWGGDRLDENLVNYLRDLRPQYKIALLSNAWDDLRQMLEGEWKIDDAFDEIIISAEIGLVKPDPRIYQRVIADLDVVPAEAVFVDDFPENVAGASLQGLHAIHFNDSDQVLRDLSHLLETN
ncbi:HAD family hydrolase [Chloroflexota bacterium]